MHVHESAWINSWWAGSSRPGTKPPQELIFFVNSREYETGATGSARAEEFWKQMVSVFMSGQVYLIDDDQWNQADRMEPAGRWTLIDRDITISWSGPLAKEVRLHRTSS